MTGNTEVSWNRVEMSVLTGREGALFGGYQGKRVHNPPEDPPPIICVDAKTSEVGVPEGRSDIKRGRVRLPSWEGEKPIPVGKYNSYLKDQVENWLHKQICTNAMTPKEAQEGIDKDWRQYIPDLVKTSETEVQ